MAIATCKHGTNIFEKVCSQCDFDRNRYEAAKAAYEPVSRNINGGSASILGAVIGREHGYLLNELAQAVAHGILMKTYDSLCTEGSPSIGSHPGHDGRLACGTVVGALRILGTNETESALDARKFWVDRAYDPEGF